jgi:hypothetical protein
MLRPRIEGVGDNVLVLSRSAARIVRPEVREIWRRAQVLFEAWQEGLLVEEPEGEIPPLTLGLTDRQLLLKRFEC